jgi:hypothetical protein
VESRTGAAHKAKNMIKRFENAKQIDVNIWDLERAHCITCKKKKEFYLRWDEFRGLGFAEKIHRGSTLVTRPELMPAKLFLSFHAQPATFPPKAPR